MFRHLFFGFLLTLTFQEQLCVAAVDALDEVNQYRANLGLQPFMRDTQLSQAAAATADYRALHLIAEHTSSDFAFLPAGASADAAGCAAWQAGSGWGSCCSSENWRYAGAAYALGQDGRRYMHLFVSNRPNAAPEYSWQRVESGWWYRKGNQYVGFLHNSRVFQWRQEDGTYSEGQRLEAGQIPKQTQILQAK